MKKIFTLAIVMLSALFLNAQDILKGTSLLGGTVGVTRQKFTSGEDETKYSSLNLSPSVGKFYKNNRMAGINIFYNYSNRTDVLDKSRQYGLGVFLRQYQPLGRSFYLFAEEGLAFFRSKSEVNYANNQFTERRSNTISLNLYPGVAYGLNKRFLIEVALSNVVNLSYSKETSDTRYTNGSPATHNKNSMFAFNTGLGNNSLSYLVFGIKYILH